MPDIEFCQLPALCQPLLDKFYRSHRSPMRTSAATQMWVAREQDIIGALCLTSVADGHWLTGLFVSPHRRGEKLASRLMTRARADLTGPVWLFCHPELARFYERSGFALATELPPTLADKLARYQRTKALVGMVNLHR